MTQSYTVIEIYTSEGARFDGKRLSEAVLDYIRKLKAPARLIAFKGSEGCYENGDVSTQKIMDLSANQPVKIEIVLPRARSGCNNGGPSGDGFGRDPGNPTADGLFPSNPKTAFPALRPG